MLVHAHYRKMSLKKWLIKTNSDGSTSDHKAALRAAAQAVNTVEQECVELQGAQEGV